MSVPQVPIDIFLTYLWRFDNPLTNKKARYPAGN